MILTQDRSAAVGKLLVAVGQPYVFESLELPTHEFRTQDIDNPVGDGKLFGRDRLTPGRATLNLLVVGDDAAEAHAHMRAFSAAWSGMVDQTMPGTVAPLEWRDGGLTRRVYGRPRTLAVNVDDSRYGLIRVTAAFELSDAVVYGPDEDMREVRIDMVPPLSGGLMDPLVAPLMATGHAERQGLIADTGGGAPTPFEVRFHGPISSPWLRGPRWEIKLGTTLAWDEVAIIDTRTGSARSSLGRNLKSTLNARSRLRDATLPPGRTELTFGGNDPTGTAYALVRWRPAFTF